MKVRDDVFYVIEAVPEFGGEQIPEYLIPASQNINIFEQALCSMTRKQLSIPSYRPGKNHVVIQYIPGKKGTLKSFSPIDPRDYDILTYSILKEIGSKTSGPLSNHDRIGFVAAVDKNRDSALGKCSSAIRDLQVTFS